MYLTKSFCEVSVCFGAVVCTGSRALALTLRLPFLAPAAAVRPGAQAAGMLGGAAQGAQALIGRTTAGGDTCRAQGSIASTSRFHRRPRGIESLSIQFIRMDSADGRWRFGPILERFCRQVKLSDTLPFACTNVHPIDSTGQRAFYAE